MNRQQLKEWWDYIQSLLDVDGDVVMLLFTAGVLYKMMLGTLTATDAVVYSSAVGCFAYSNRGGSK